MSEAFVWPQLKHHGAGASLGDLRREAEAAGRAAGHEQGLAEGREAARAEVDEMRTRLGSALESLERQLDDYRIGQVDRLAAVAHALCARVVGHELRTSVDALESVLAEALGRLEADAGAAEVFVNPQDHAVLAGLHQGAMALHSDPSVPPCSVSVRLPTQASDFQPLTLLDELFEDIRNDLAG
ncbi:MAG: FliH/SctL family protein [Pseudomonadales bacterium]